jgi:hypothetical protein
VERRFVLKNASFLPRQARDRHGETALKKRGDAFSCRTTSSDSIRQDCSATHGRAFSWVPPNYSYRILPLSFQLEIESDSLTCVSRTQPVLATVFRFLTSCICRRWFQLRACSQMLAGVRAVGGGSGRQLNLNGLNVTTGGRVSQGAWGATIIIPNL